MEKPVLAASPGVSLSILEAVQSSMAPDVLLAIGNERESHRADPGYEWISFVASSEWWRAAFATYAAVYVAEIVKEAAKGTWRSRARVAGLATRLGSNLIRLARLLVGAVGQAPANTKLRLRATQGDDYIFVLESDARSENELTAEILLLTYFLPQVSQWITSTFEGQRPSAFAIRLTPEAGIAIRWFDASTDRFVTQEFSLEEDF